MASAINGPASLPIKLMESMQRTKNKALTQPLHWPQDHLVNGIKMETSRQKRWLELTVTAEMQQTRCSIAWLHSAFEYAVLHLHRLMANHAPDAEFHVEVSCPDNNKIFNSQLNQLHADNQLHIKSSRKPSSNLQQNGFQHVQSRE